MAMVPDFIQQSGNGDKMLIAPGSKTWNTLGGGLPAN
jgi:hypothetical protein